MDLTSIIIPIFNQRKELLAALASIKNQTYKNIEVFVVEDGGEDKIKIEDLRFKVNSQMPVTLVEQENRGAPSARNRGLAMAKGEYVIFWDADVIGEPEMLEKMYQTLRKNPQASYAYCNYNYQLLNINYFPLRRPRRGGAVAVKINFKSQIFNIQKLREDNYIHSTSLIRRKDAIKWDENLKRFQDWDLWLTMAEQNKTGVYIPETLFTITAKGVISSWLPSVVYKKPWKYLPWIREKVKKYEDAKKIIFEKHQ